MSETIHQIVTDFELAAGAKIHRYTNSSNIEVSAIYLGNNEIQWTERCNEIQMCLDWNDYGCEPYLKKEMKSKTEKDNSEEEIKEQSNEEDFDDISKLSPENFCVQNTFPETIKYGLLIFLVLLITGVCLGAKIRNVSNQSKETQIQMEEFTGEIIELNK